MSHQDRPQAPSAAGTVTIRLRGLVTTVGAAEDARLLADAAVERRLAACVQIEAIESVYRWQGAVQHEPEWRLLFKTTAAAEPALRSLLLERHPYELPALYTIELADPSAAFAAWVVESTTPLGR
jgi:periplasmic divalent cation tolerance protein